MPKPDPEAYREAYTRSRAIAQELIEDRTARIQEAVASVHQGLERRLRDLPPGASREEILRLSVDAVDEQYFDLKNTLKAQVAEGRTASFEAILEDWRRVGRNVLLGEGGALSDVRTVPIDLVNAFDAIGSAQNWRTLLESAADNAAEEANLIMRHGIAENVGADELARRMRFYVEGSEDFREAFEEVPTLTGDVAKIDLRSFPDGTRGAAKDMVFNSRRIAFSEIQNARAEAELQHYVEDPLIEAFRWVLSPNRGVNFSPPDECDVLAASDLYGMGKGVYPLHGAPSPPHPFDRCEKRPVTRGLEDMKKPKPTPAKSRGFMDFKDEFPDLTFDQFERIADRAHAAHAQGQAALDKVRLMMEEGVEAVMAQGADVASTEGLARSPQAVADELEEIQTRGEEIRERVQEEWRKVDDELKEANEKLEPLKARKDQIQEAWLEKGTEVADLNQEALNADFKIQDNKRMLRQLGDRAEDPEVWDAAQENIERLERKRRRLKSTIERAQEARKALRTDLEEARVAYNEARDEGYMALARRKGQLHRRKRRVEVATRNEQRKILARPPDRRNTVELDHQLRKNTDQIDEGVEGFRSLVDRKYLEDMTLEGSPASSRRAFYSNANKSVNLHPDGRSPRTVIHEIAHAIEYEHPEVAEASRAFFAGRTEGEPLRKLQDILKGQGYRGVEKAKPDEFYHPYVGKVYSGRAATEIVTMGLEKMYADPLGFWEADPGHFAFTWKLMNGVF